MDQDISSILSSAAKFQVLEALLCQSAAMPLRHIALCCELPVRSVQVALLHLTQGKLVKESKQKHWTLFTLNRHSKYYPLIAAIFQEVMKFRLQERAASSSKSARQALEFSKDLANLTNFAKGKYSGYRNPA